MKRSRINQIIASADEFIRSFGVTLPPFAYLDPEEMKTRGPELSGLIAARMGWDITDYGGCDFDRLGLALFTLRNGRLEDLKAGRGMCYAEKLLISRQDQISPMHRHILKAEDIINRGGATLAVELFGPTPDGSFDDTRGGSVTCDGIARPFTAGEVLRLAPGESVTLLPGLWHAFWGDGGDVLIGEVSTVNDDLTDNVFRDPISRFAEVEEDVPPLHLLVSDYDRWLG